ncbi:MAG: hypothetical protein A49_23730 [Methyloceanibacter sp.]|nr:MAG: hypothetical protein A49_23730 [Methyloceanibacter sp.]
MAMPSAEQMRSRESRLAEAMPFSIRLSMALDIPEPRPNAARVTFADKRRCRMTSPIRFSNGAVAVSVFAYGPSGSTAGTVFDRAFFGAVLAELFLDFAADMVLSN